MFNISKKTSNVLKIFSIFTVMLSHSVDVGCLPFDRKYWAILCQIGMSVFLFLSGYGVFSSFVTNGLDNYWNKKVDKIYLPYLLIVIFDCVVEMIKDNFYSKKTYIEALCLGNLLLPFDGSLWYVS